MASCALAVDQRSSHSRTGRPKASSKLRAKARLDWARGPSEPSILRGSPSTIAFTSRLSINSAIRSLSRPHLPRPNVLCAVAKRQPASHKAVPMVFVPRSRPSRTPPLVSASPKSMALSVIRMQAPRSRLLQFSLGPGEQNQPECWPRTVGYRKCDNRCPATLERPS